MTTATATERVTRTVSVEFAFDMDASVPHEALPDSEMARIIASVLVSEGCMDKINENGSWAIVRLVTPTF